MKCELFGVCGSCKNYDLTYKEQIDKKIGYIQELFKSQYTKKIDLFVSPDTCYRNRAEFRVWHDDDGMHYAMNKVEKGGVVLVKRCQIVNKEIADLMTPLISAIKRSITLREKLFSIEFLSSNRSILVSMIYHKKIDDMWRQDAQKLQNKFKISIIGRSKKIKVVLGDDFVFEDLKVRDRVYVYKIIEGSFSQPNSSINSKMIEWATTHVGESEDLLELYCGHGNFTIPFAGQFKQVLATEISKTSIKAAKNNCDINSVENIKFVRMSVEELMTALRKEREFVRLKDIDLDKYNFSHVFVDPPRAGMDTKSLEFISRFDNIIYISCNPVTLKRDLDFLKSEFEVENFALFDQFPYTDHIELGIILKKVRKKLWSV